MDYKNVAQRVLELAGGKENISQFEHCSTRLRLTLVDDDKSKDAEIEKLEGVVGVRHNVQLQVIIGNEVNEVYDQFRDLMGGESAGTQKADKKKKQSLGALVLDFIVAVFQPLVPAIAGGGVLKSVLMLFALFGWMSSSDANYKILMQVGDAPLYFLPLLVAITAANKLKVNPLVAVSAVSGLLLPTIGSMLKEGTALFGFGLQNIAYAYQIFPAILAVLLYAGCEKFFTKYSPKAVRIFLVPMLSLVVTVPATLIVLGPLGFEFGQVFAGVILWLFERVGWIATALLAAALPFMVSTGMHKAMLPYAVATMNSLGKEILYLPASLAHNISESGAAFGTALKTKDANLRATAISSGISALFGITEPALYGVTLQHKAVLLSVVISSLIGGAYIGIVAISAFALVGPGLASLTMYVDPTNPQNLVNALIAFALSFVLSLAVAFFTFKDPVQEVAEEISEEDLAQATFAEDAQTPVEGELLPLSQVKDDVFASKMVGDGVAIDPMSDNLLSPVDGVVEMIYETGHAVCVKSDNGVEYLMHIGIDTVQLAGKNFAKQVQVGQKVKMGDLLVTFDRQSIAQEGYDTTVMFVVTNYRDFKLDVLKEEGPVAKGDLVLTVTK